VQQSAVVIGTATLVIRGANISRMPLPAANAELMNKNGNMGRFQAGMARDR